MVVSILLVRYHELICMVEQAEIEIWMGEHRLVDQFIMMHISSTKMKKSAHRGWCCTYLTTIGIRFFSKFFTVCTPLMLSSLANGENFALASSGKLMTSSFCVLHFRYLPLSYIVVKMSPAWIVLLKWLQRNVSRTSTRRFGLRERSKTDSMQRVDRPSSLSSSKKPGYVSGIRTLGPTEIERKNTRTKNANNQSMLLKSNWKIDEKKLFKVTRNWIKLTVQYISLKWLLS